MNSATRSPMVMVVTLVLARMQLGMMEASTTRMFSMPWNAAVLVDDGHGVAGRAHLAGAGDVLASGGVPQHAGIQRIIAGQLFVGGLDSLLDDVAERFVFAQLGAQTHRVAQAAAVLRVLHVVVVKERLFVGVGGIQPGAARSSTQGRAH